MMTLTIRLTRALPLLFALAVVAFPHTATAQSLDQRNNLKKLSQYLDDGFCDDALALASRLTRREGSSQSFEAWFGVARAHRCAHRIGPALDSVDALRQALTPSPQEAERLNAFVDEIQGAFAQLRIHLPNERGGKPRLVVTPISLVDPALQLVAEAIAEEAAEGVAVPGPPLYLPQGTYEIDFSIVTLETFPGETFNVGRERLSPQRRSQIGEGQALGLGILGLAGFEGEALSIEQLSGESQVIVTEERLGLTSTPYLSLSSTHSFPAGTLGRASFRADGRLRPAIGGDSEAGDPSPFYGSVGVAGLIHRVEEGWTLQGGAGLRGSYLGYYTFIGLIEEGDGAEGETDAYRIAIDAPVFLLGPELTMLVGRTFIPSGAGSSRGLRVQVGLEASAGFNVMLPSKTSGEATLSDGSALSYSLITELTLGTTAGLTAYVRVPFF